MIEEFMLLANQCAAHFARVKQIPFVYRVHEEPNAEKLERLHGLLQACGVNDHFAKDVPTPKELSAILEGVRGTAYEQIINVGMLRCMSKAVYEENPRDTTVWCCRTMPTSPAPSAATRTWPSTAS